MGPGFIIFGVFIFLVIVFVIIIFCFCDDTKKSGKMSKFKKPKRRKFKSGSSLDDGDIEYGENVEEAGYDGWMDGNNEEADQENTCDYGGGDDGGGYDYGGGDDGGGCDYGGGDAGGGCDYGGGDSGGGDCGGE